MPEVQVSDGILRKYFCVKNLCRHVRENHSRNLQASNSTKERQLNRAKPQEVKDNSYNFLKPNGKSAKHCYLPPNYHRESF